MNEHEVKVKFCGLTRECDIEAANRLKPEYIGFVFAEKSRRYINVSEAQRLKKALSPNIKAVGVFVNAQADAVAAIADSGIIDMVQLHGDEDDDYINRLHGTMNNKEVQIIKAFVVRTKEDVLKAGQSAADYVLLDAGSGEGVTFDWGIIEDMGRPFFLAGGLSPDNVLQAVNACQPYAVDVSSGIETNGAKDENKMAEFLFALKDRP